MLFSILFFTFFNDRLINGMLCCQIKSLNENLKLRRNKFLNIQTLSHDLFATITTTTTTTNYYYYYRMLLHGAAIEVMILPICSILSSPLGPQFRTVRERRSLPITGGGGLQFVCRVGGVANAINTRTNRRMTARTLNPGPHTCHGESFYPGLVEEQSAAFRDGSLLITWGDEMDDDGG